MALPLENLDNKNFSDFFDEALSRINQYAPRWTDHNISDPGIMLVELFSWLADMQIYSLNRIKEAERRKFLKLLGFVYPVTPVPARGLVTFVPVDPDVVRPVVIDKGTRVFAYAQMENVKIPFELSDELVVVRGGLEGIFSYNAEQEVLVDNREINDIDNIFYYAFGNHPRPEDALYLGLSAGIPDVKISVGFFLREEETREAGETIGYRKTEIFPPAVLRWEYYNGSDWVELKLAQDQTRNLTRTGTISFSVPADWRAAETLVAAINLPPALWVRCRFLEGGYPNPPRIDKILLNTVTVFQFESRELEFSSNGLPDQVMVAGKGPLFKNNNPADIYTELEELDSPVLLVREQDGLKTWSSVEDFDASQPDSPHYILDILEGTLSFGDNVRGRIPPETPPGTSKSIFLRCKSCLGETGNVAAAAITDPGAGLKDTLRVFNYLPASGGRNPLTLQEALLQARNDLKLRYRAVTLQDYEEIVLGTPELRVARVKAVRGYHPALPAPAEGVIAIIVVPGGTEIDNAPGEGFYRTIYTQLDKYRLLTTEIFVIPPIYIEVGVSARLVVKKEALPDATIARVKKRLSHYLHPLHGGQNGTGWEFGRSVYFSHIYRIIDEIEGVDYVEDVRLQLDGQSLPGDVTIPMHGLVKPGNMDDITEKSVTGNGSRV